jgi:hypothetical protein
MTRMARLIAPISIFHPIFDLLLPVMPAVANIVVCISILKDYSVEEMIKSADELIS